MSPMKLSSPTTIAIIGTGQIGPRHAEAIQQESEAELFCMVDPNPAAEQIAKQFNVEWFSSIQDMLRSKGKPDSAIVCTPNHTHVAVSEELLRANVHVLCEKPLSPDSVSGNALVRVAEEKKLQLLVGHHRRFNCYISATKKVLLQKHIGRVVAVSGLWTTYKPRSYFDAPSEWRRGTNGGPILINLIHEVDILQYLLGPIARVHAEHSISERGFEAEEGAVIILKFRNGVVGSFVLLDTVPSPHNFESGTGENPIMPKTGQDVYRFFGTEGTLSVPDMKLWNYGAAQEKSWSSVLSLTNIDVEEEKAPFELQVKHFVEVLHGNERPICSGDDGLRAVIVCEAVKQAMESGLPVDIPASRILGK